MNRKIQTVRIIGGAWRSRVVHFADIPGLRPTQDRVRETLFNWLAPFIEGASCLDLFAGSGVLGFEALSRGARFCCFVDHHLKALSELRTNAEKLQLTPEQAAILHGDFPKKTPPLPGAPFDIIFLDPPFQENYLQAAVEWLASSKYLQKNAWVYMEMKKETKIILPPNWEVHRQKKTSSLIYQLIKTYPNIPSPFQGEG